MDKVLYILAGAILGYVIGREYKTQIYQQLEKILKLSIMSDENLQELLTRVRGLEANGVATAESLTNIKSDITRIIEGIPATGGLSEAETATLKEALTSAETAIQKAKEQAASLDAENEPDAEEPPAEQ